MLSCSGCSNPFHLWEDYYESFVRRYWIIDKQDTAIVETSKSFVLIKLPHRVYARPTPFRGDNLMEQELQVERFDELSKRYGDINFNRWVSSEDSWLGTSWAFPFAVFEVVSNLDFDEQHPAGTPLNDVMTIRYYTYKLYIENGYKHTDERAIASNDYSGDWVTKPLSEFVPEDAIFMAPDYAFELYFVTTPTNEQHHHLTLTVGLEGEDPYTVEFDMDFGGSE